jgi:hypothetical protein
MPQHAFAACKSCHFPTSPDLFLCHVRCARLRPGCAGVTSGRTGTTACITTTRGHGNRLLFCRFEAATRGGCARDFEVLEFASDLLRAVCLALLFIAFLPGKIFVLLTAFEQYQTYERVR